LTIKRLALVMALGAVLLLVAGACGGNGEKQVTGLVLAAVERNLAEIELLKVRDDNGKIWEFASEGQVGTSAAHLRQHQIGGERVLVTYREDDGRLIAIDVRDASSPGG